MQNPGEGSFFSSSAPVHSERYPRTVPERWTANQQGSVTNWLHHIATRQRDRTEPLPPAFPPADHHRPHLTTRRPPQTTTGHQQGEYSIATDQYQPRPPSAPTPSHLHQWIHNQSVMAEQWKAQNPTKQMKGLPIHEVVRAYSETREQPLTGATTQAVPNTSAVARATAPPRAPSATTLPHPIHNTHTTHNAYSTHLTTPAAPTSMYPPAYQHHPLPPDASKATEDEPVAVEEMDGFYMRLPLVQVLV